MPAQGAAGRAHQLGTLAGLTHERATAAEVGEWLSELDDAVLDELDRDIVRLARRDWERARRVPEELAVELARASAEGQESWRRARPQDDFSSFVRALERNVELARAYGECVAEEGESPYDALIGDYDFGLRPRSSRACSARSPRRCRRSSADARALAPRRARSTSPWPRSEAAVASTLRAAWRRRARAGAWTSRRTRSPPGSARRDTRLTTRYGDGEVESLLSSLHEYGHALYERQIDAALERTNLGRGTSMSMHESQSKLWENHVGAQSGVRRGAGRRPRRRRVRGRPRRSCTRRSSGVEPSLIRVSADPLTYPLHIILRFELELALIEGELAVARPARGVARRDAPPARRRGSLGRARHACRTCTGGPAASATSRATRSAA